MAVMQKIAFVLGNFYPNPSANGNCCGTIMTKMKEYGYEPVCISCSQDGSESETTWNGIKNFHFSVPLKYRLQILENSKHGISKKVLNKGVKIIGYHDILLSAFSYPLMPNNYYLTIYEKIEQVYSYTHFNTIVGVSYPVDAAYAVAMFKKKHPEIKAIAYFLDPFVDGRKHKFISKGRALKKAYNCERWIADHVDLLIAQKEHRNHYEQYYKSLVDNKIQFLGVPLLENRAAKHMTGQTIHAVYAGSLYTEIRNPKFIIEVFKGIPNIIFDIYTPASKEWLETYVGGANNVVVHKKVSHKEVEKILANADILVNIGNSLENSSPSKLIEYMGYCKPIISTYRLDGDPCIEIMRKYPLGIAVDERKDMQFAIEAINGLITSESTVDYSDLEPVFWTDTPKAVVDLMLNIKNDV